MTLSYKKTDLKFKKNSDTDIKCIGSIEEVRTARVIQYSPVKLQQAQVQPVKVESMLTFKKEITEQLYLGKLITDVVVTEDNKLLLCDFQKERYNIYVFKINQQNLAYNTTLSVPSGPYGISKLTGTDKVIVTLPYKSYVQFIDTNTLTLDKTIKVGRDCFGITTTGDYIAVGKIREIKIFKSKGENIRNIVLSDLLDDSKYVSSLHYNHNDGSIIYRKMGLISRIQFDGTISYRYVLSGEAGLAVDTQGQVYVCEFDRSEIQRLLPDGRVRDVVMTYKDGIKDPFAIAFNERFTKFVVTSINGLVQIYNCK
ncbi:uncharacterized protein LOC127712412 [Mytilus californianus]|uniref:uncharacterized protein LOC127712412 n=1 Tax=Mytilus californianus TaxID=6549 RepID=UPI0022473AEF|nr:uncharacterized protein LOC127712412 [Mytilus californianus]